jgi:hypothetical protein
MMTIPHTCFDNVGEKRKRRHYGKACNVMAEVLLTFHSSFKKLILCLRCERKKLFLNKFVCQYNLSIVKVIFWFYKI